jgi:heat shock protein HslJ
MKCLAIACFSLVTACQSPTEPLVTHPKDTAATVKTVVAPPDTTTLGGTWWLQPVLPSDTAAGRTPTLSLDLAKSHFTGNTGCNNMRGTFWFSAKDSSLSFSDKVIQTRMACPGYNEASFMKSLRSAGRYRLRSGMLILLSDDNSELSHWVRKPVAAPKAVKT